MRHIKALLVGAAIVLLVLSIIAMLKMMVELFPLSGFIIVGSIIAYGIGRLILEDSFK